MSLSTSPGNNENGRLAKAIRIGLSFVNYSKPFGEITTSTDDLSSPSSTTANTKTATFNSKSNNVNNNINFHTGLNNNNDSKCPGDFCSRATSVSSLSPSLPSSSSSGRTASGSRITNSISVSGSGERIEGLRPGNEFTNLESTSTPKTNNEQLKVNLVGSRITDYYSDYDPMMGIRIAISLLGIIVLFAIFVVYKSHCNAKKAKRLLPYRGSTRSVSGYRTP
ncbi:serum response factor homolog B [Tetranychus urticae]|uniref:serum response factor homolog B n=1 Tax=Tetranychus urticae TaxID=32264 RepID=UPI00077BB4FB|nr:serum response factor homolog B [Tetranychus urticae]XP_015789607.1 serum response factor homolog B [Tetranychus urticae]XP_015789608.1 serum response factor homolog B [Tetranychus urticae]XP_025017478.1 serum response factor homolog B [Tetranychus urticae]XP_025017479.1 serum response factor homolog B [Tetranychus urticae]